MNIKVDRSKPISSRALLVWAISLVALAMLAACNDSSSDPLHARCAVPTFDPAAGRKAVPWPSDAFTVIDESTPTGLRVHFAPNDPPSDDPIFWWYGERLLADINTLDGFSPFSQLVVEFRGVLDPVSLPGEATSTTQPGSGVYLINTDEDSLHYGETTPVETEYFVELNQVFFKPIYPLSLKERHALVLTNRFKSVRGGCSAPDVSMAIIIGGGDAGAPAHFVEGVHAALDIVEEQFGVEKHEIILAVSFTTQSIEEQMLALRQAEMDRADRERIYDPDSLQITPGAASDPIALLIEGKMREADYRNEEGIIEFESDGSPPQPKFSEVTFSLTIPREDPARGIVQPFPIVLFQHGLNNIRQLAFGLAETIGADGFAFIAIDATGHGERRTYSSDDWLKFLEHFLGMYLTADGLYVKPKVPQDFLRTMSIDHFQVVNLIEQLGADGFDIYNAGVSGPTGGDSIADLDTDNIMLTGTSLGGITGGLTYAYETRIRNAYLNVPAAGLTNLVFYTPFIGPAEGLLNLLDPSRDIRRFLIIFQTFVDRADAIHTMRRVFREPFEGVDPRSLLIQLVVDDDLENRSTADMAAAAGAPLLEPAIKPLPYLPRVAVPSQGLSENMGQGVTAGLFEFDNVRFSVNGDWSVADHGTMLLSYESTRQASKYFRSELEDGVAVIIDPYLE